jgi:probable selenium-dependent hydroxylase accessory protein YqeC
MDLAEALALDARELVAFVGAGGKKTAMSALATDGHTDCQVGYTTTTHMPPPSELPLVVASAGDIQTRLAGQSPVAFGAEWVENPERATRKLRGYEPPVLDDLFQAGGVERLLVKADGARKRGFKAPAAHEPAIPEKTSLVVIVASVQVVGEALSEQVVHRPEQVAAITDLAVGDELTPAAVGTVLASPDGGLKRVPDESRVFAMINKADSASPQATARKILRTVAARSDRFSDGLVTSFREGVCFPVAMDS